MLKTHRASTTAVLIVCLLGGPSSGILFASDKEPAKLIAFFVCDHDTPLTIAPIDGHAGHEAR